MRRGIGGLKSLSAQVITSRKRPMRRVPAALIAVLLIVPALAARAEEQKIHKAHAIAMHGGWAELVEVEGATAYLRLGGGCQGCGMAAMTLRHGIERAIRAAVPEIADIIDVTDHASGANPYYEPSKK